MVKPYFIRKEISHKNSRYWNGIGFSMYKESVRRFHTLKEAEIEADRILYNREIYASVGRD